MTPQRALTRLAVALTLSMSTWFSASAVIPQLRGEWDLSRGTAAWLTIAVQLGFVAGALLSSVGNLADIYPPHVVILIGSIGAATANLLLVAADGPESAIPLRFATGFFLAGVYPPAFKLMATWFTRGRAFALGTLAGAIALGSAIPHLVNGIGGLDWKLVVVATSVLTLAGGVIAVAPSSRRARTRSRERSSTRARRARSSATAACGSPRSATSATCGSSSRCGRGFSSSSATATTRAAPRPPTRPSR